MLYIYIYVFKIYIYSKTSKTNQWCLKSGQWFSLGGGSDLEGEHRGADSVLLLDLFPLKSHQAIIFALYCNVCSISIKSNETIFFKDPIAEKIEHLKKRRLQQ